MIIPFWVKDPVVFGDYKRIFHLYMQNISIAAVIQNIAQSEQ